MTKDPNEAYYDSISTMGEMEGWLLWSLLGLKYAEDGGDKEEIERCKESVIRHARAWGRIYNRDHGN